MSSIMNGNGERTSSMDRDVTVRLAEMEDPLAYDALSEILKLRYELAHHRAIQRCAIDGIAEVLAKGDRV